MDELEIIQPEENTESAEVGEATERTEEQTLEEAAHEPGAHVEETQDIAQAEAVEAELAEAVANADATAATDASQAPQQESGVKPDEPESLAQNPITGKSYGQQTQESSGESGEEEPAIAVTEDRTAETEVQVQSEGITDVDAAGQEPGDTEVDPSRIDGNEPVTEMDGQEPDPSGAISEGVGELEKGTGQVDPQRYQGELPEELLYPKEGPGMKGPKSGGKIPGGGSSTSGGGPPVGGPGGGSKGNTADDILGAAQRQRDLQKMKEDDEASKAGGLSSDKTPHFDSDGNYYYYDSETTFWVCVPADQSQVSYTLDGDTPMPYTGGGNWGGENPDPDEPVGGIDREAGAFFPVYGKGGGKDSGGGTPGDKDGDDDSGKFLADGELSGDGGMLDPGDLDYNKANQANTELNLSGYIPRSLLRNNSVR